jgi:hypothetical protein
MPLKPPPHSGKIWVSEAIDHRLEMYSIAALTAGVSMLALAKPAEAEVIVSRKNIPILPLNTFVTLDINRDGIADFQFIVTTFAYNVFHADFAEFPLQEGNAVVGAAFTGDYGPYASALGHRVEIGPAARFTTAGRVNLERSFGRFNSTRSTLSRHTAGKWGGDNLPDRYLGVKFEIDGATHYGWVRITMDISNFSATITGYAFETIADKPILSGVNQGSDVEVGPPAQTSNAPGLGVLALGVNGFPLWLRERLAEK